MGEFSVRSADRIALRFTREELLALLALLDLPALPGTEFIPLPPTEKTLRSLEEGEWVTAGEGYCMVQRIAAMVITNAAFSRHFLLAEDGLVRTCVYRCRQMYVLLRDGGGKWVTLEPLGSAAAARRPFLQAIEGQGTGHIVLTRDGSPMEGRIAQAEEYYARLEEDGHADDYR